MKRLTSAQVQQVCKRYQGGESSVTLAVAFDVSSVAICGLLKRRGIPRRATDVAQRRYACNHAFFATITSESQAYWLGFLAADGGISDKGDIVLSLALRDKEHLTGFAAALESNHPVREWAYPKVSYAKFSVSSREMAMDLAQYGIIPRKTNTIRFPDLPEGLERHFVRGYFDGDGGFTVSKGSGATMNVLFSVIGNLAFIESLQAVLTRECNLRKTFLSQRRAGQPVWSLRYSGRRQVTRIVEYLYCDATIFLPRKHEYISSYLV